jgi:FSR family fosmidomycin resistance protein-like MFS transporter
MDILYNILAFGLQVPFGIIADKYRCSKIFVLVSLILLVLGVILQTYFLAMILIIGIANALFHIGGGVASLNILPKKATIPGMFVAPGSVGLFLGMLISKFKLDISLFIILVLVLTAFLSFYSNFPKINYNRSKVKINYFEGILLLLLFSIIVRSFVGSILVFPWKGVLVLAIVLSLFVFLGKFIGGYIADKFGWKKVAVWALILSVLPLSFFQNSPILAILGVFLFNLVMPITLVAVANLFPGRAGFAFGLNCLALLFGFLMYSLSPLSNTPYWVFVLISFAIASIYFAFNNKYLNR